MHVAATGGGRGLGKSRGNEQGSLQQRERMRSAAPDDGPAHPRPHAAATQRGSAAHSIGHCIAGRRPVFRGRARGFRGLAARGRRRSGGAARAAPAASRHLRHQLAPSCDAGGSQVALLDVAVAPDLIGQAGDFQRQRRGWRPSAPAITSSMLARYSPISARSVLRSSVRPKMSSGVPRRPLSCASSLKAGQHRRAEFLLLQFALVVALGDHRRRQMVVELEVALEHGRDPVLEAAVARAGARPRTRPCRPSA